MWKEGLIWKLRNLGIGEDTVRLVDSFLTDRDARVSVDGGESDKFREINGAKTELLIMDTGNRKRNARTGRFRVFQLRVNGAVVKEKKAIKYLGIMFTRKGHGNLAAKNRAKLDNISLVKLRKLLCNEYLSQNVKVILYKTLIRPIITYGSPIWNDCTKTPWKTLRAAETKALRCMKPKSYCPITKKNISNQKLYECIKIDPLSSLVEKLNRNFVTRYTNHINSWIRLLRVQKSGVDQKEGYT